MNILHLDTCKSTNLEARKICDYEADIPTQSGFAYLNGRPYPNVIVSRKQTQGKGRSGNWFSPEDCGIYMSVITDNPQFKLILNSAGINKLMHMLTDILAEILSGYFQLKIYPATKEGPNGQYVSVTNDIYLAGKKLAGILCEYYTSTDKLIVGVGINTFRPVKIRKDLVDKIVYLNDYAAEYLIDHKKLIYMIAEGILNI